MATAIKPCKCTHSYQDATYGKGQRLMNSKKVASKDATPTYTCTVCKTPHKGN